MQPIQSTTETQAFNPGLVNQPLQNVQANEPETLVELTEIQTNDVLPDVVIEQGYINPTENSFCVQVSLSKWGTSKKADINKIETQADKAYMRVRKVLLESKKYDKITRCDNRLRKDIRMIALPSEFRDGFWLIAKTYVRQMRDMLTKYKAERQVLVDDFLTEYVERKDAAKAKLGDQFNERDYPSVEQMKFLFSMTWKFTEFGLPADLSELDPEIYAEEYAKYQQEIRNEGAEIVLLMRQEAAKIIGHLVERLTTTPGRKKKVFKSSSIENIEDFLKFFEVKNSITRDGGLAEAVNGIRAAMESEGGKFIDAESLRTNDELRDNLRTKLAGISETLDTLVKEKTNTRRVAFFETASQETA